MTTPRYKQLSYKQFEKVSNMYWELGYFQSDIADIFNCSQPHISRIVNNKARGYHSNLLIKATALSKNIVPPKHEVKQAKTLHAKRHRLHSTKLTWNKVCNMRRLYLTGENIQKELAVIFGINQGGVSRIIAGHKWKEKG